MDSSAPNSAWRDLLDALRLIRADDHGTTAARPDATPSEGPDPYGNPAPEWLEINWPDHLNRCEVSRTTVNYVEMGSPGDPAVILIHGLDGCWQNWLETIPHLARTRRVLALDLPGFGHSPLPSWKISVPAYRDLIAGFMVAVGIERAEVVGNSLGGLVAVEHAIARPDDVAKLVLVAPAGISTARVRTEPALVAARMMAGLAPLWMRFQGQAVRRPRLLDLAFRTIFHQPTGLRRELLYEHYRNGSGRPGFLPAVEAVTGHRPNPSLDDLTAPTLIVWGRDDMILPVSDATGYGSLLPNSQTVIFAGAGHLPQLERPVRFNRVLDSFLETG